MRNCLFLILYFAFTTSAFSQAITEDSLTFNRFGLMHLYKPDQPAQVALVVSGDSGWTKEMDSLVRRLTDRQILVAGIDGGRLLHRIAQSTEARAYPAGDFEALSQELQVREKMVTYTAPLLVGFGSGAAIVYATLAQAPPNTFRGAVSIDFCPRVRLARKFCRGHGLDSDLDIKNGFATLQPSKTLTVPWIVLHRAADTRCTVAALRNFVHESAMAQIIDIPDTARHLSWLDEFDIACTGAAAVDPQTSIPTIQELRDLPLVEIPAAPGDSNESLLAVIISGDGGWASIDRDIGEYLARSGIAVVGINALKYFWSRKAPEQAALDLARIMRTYLHAWKKEKVILVGYSRGADVLPFMAARLPDALLSRVALTALLGPETTVDFKFHLGDFFGSPKHAEDLPTLPEVQKLYGTPVACFYGADEDGSLCPNLDTTQVTVCKLKGGHHFDGDYVSIARTILQLVNNPTAPVDTNR